MACQNIRQETYDFFRASHRSHWLPCFHLLLCNEYIPASNVRKEPSSTMRLEMSRTCLGRNKTLLWLVRLQGMEWKNRKRKFNLRPCSFILCSRVASLFGDHLSGKQRRRQNQMTGVKKSLVMEAIKIRAQERINYTWEEGKLENLLLQSSSILPSSSYWYWDAWLENEPGSMEESKPWQ